ncbi:MAG: flagellar basal body-associated FliL family protein [Clostridia bacterium]|nr:flagellar basal body-associated FliL family protein [Clostridia bacterium]
MSRLSGRAGGVAALLLAALLLGGCNLPGKSSSAAPKAEPPVAVDVGTLTTNLSDADPPRLVQVDVVLEVGGQAAADQLKAAEPAVRDAVLRVLRATSAAQLAGAQGMDAVRARIESEVERAVPDVRVRDVYFTSFVVQ